MDFPDPPAVEEVPDEGLKSDGHCGDRSNKPKGSVPVGGFLTLEHKRVRLASRRSDLPPGDRSPQFCILGQRERVNSPRFLEGLSFAPLFPLACLSRPSSDRIRES
jgi:hypothetical protein